MQHKRPTPTFQQLKECPKYPTCPLGQYLQDKVADLKQEFPELSEELL